MDEQTKRHLDNVRNLIAFYERLPESNDQIDVYLKKLKEEEYNIITEHNKQNNLEVNGGTGTTEG